MEKKRCQYLQLFHFIFLGSTPRPCGMKWCSLKPLSAAAGQAGLTAGGMKGGESSGAEHFFCPADPLPLLLPFSVKKIKQGKQTHSKCHQSSSQSRRREVIKSCGGRKLMKTSPRILQPTATKYNQKISGQMCTNTPTPPRWLQDKAPKWEITVNRLKPVSGSSQFSELF